jgi:hypothetical protein
MRKLYSAESILLIAHLRNVLEAEGIAAFIRNDRLAGALGEIPFTECWPELWIRNPGDVLRARALITDELHRPVARESWTCSRCGEVLGGQFSDCWRCAGELEVHE